MQESLLSCFDKSRPATVDTELYHSSRHDSNGYTIKHWQLNATFAGDYGIGQGAGVQMTNMTGV